MSDRPIQVGDLVVTVRGCCDVRVGRIFTVGEIWKTDTHKCVHCGKGVRKGSRAIESVENPADIGALVSWVRRIPPLDEPAETYTTEKHKEPA